MVDFELIEDNNGQIDVDDFSLIEWQSAFSSSPTPHLFSIESQQPAFIGLNNYTTKSIVLSY